MTDDAKRVFNNIASCEISTYEWTYAPSKAVVSTGDLAKNIGWTKYRTRKAIRELISDGMIERACIGCPAIVSCGEVPELICDARPPMNGYAITKKGFNSPEWKDIYSEWEQNLRDWAYGGFDEEIHD